MRACVVKLLLTIYLGMSAFSASGRVFAQVVIITSEQTSIDSLSYKQLRNIYKGRLTQIEQEILYPINFPSGSKQREQFLKVVLQQNEFDYSGYWHVRRYSGQGTPPKEIRGLDELFNLLQRQKGAVVYLNLDQLNEPLNLPKGLKILPTIQ
jgi:ABC-type phosphate transport system substrate-binding protein